MAVRARHTGDGDVLAQLHRLATEESLAVVSSKPVAEHTPARGRANGVLIGGAGVEVARVESLLADGAVIVDGAAEELVVVSERLPILDADTALVTRNTDVVVGVGVAEGDGVGADSLAIAGIRNDHPTVDVDAAGIDAVGFEACAADLSTVDGDVGGIDAAAAVFAMVIEGGRTAVNGQVILDFKTDEFRCGVAAFHHYATGGLAALPVECQVATDMDALISLTVSDGD